MSTSLAEQETETKERAKATSGYAMPVTMIEEVKRVAAERDVGLGARPRGHRASSGGA